MKDTHENGKPQENTSDILDEISMNLSRQIMEELDQVVSEENKRTERKKASDIDEEDYEEASESVKKDSKKRKTGMVRIALSLIVGIVCIVANSLLVNYSLRVNNSLNSFNYINDNEEIVNKNPGELVEDKEDPTPSPEIPKPEVINRKVVNILLVGEENVYGDSVGRSDSMMIATINAEQKSLKLTSLMRDIYIKIPGFLPNKLNASYNNGGGKLLTDTIELNFGIPIDGYVVVNFQGLEDIIDILGGVEVTLTSSEAWYLNSTNYISKYEYHTLVEGTQVLNGNQAVGYCRVRYQTANNGEHDDFGRTYRQRYVLTSIFNAYKHKSPTEMIEIANKIIPYISTNIERADLINYITLGASLVAQGATELETLRIPVDHTYYGGSILCGYQNSDALTIDYTENIRIMNNFMYGPDENNPAKKASAEDLVPGEGYIPSYERYGN